MGPFNPRRPHGRHLVAMCVIFALAGCNGTSQTTSSSGSSSTAAAVTIAGMAASAVTVGNVYSFQPTAAAASGTIGYSIQNKPTWASFSTATGQLLGTPTIADIGAYQNIVITASNGSTNASLPAFSITVSQPATSAVSNSPGSVTLTWTPPTTNTDGTPLTDLAGFYINYGDSSSTLTTTIDDETGTDAAGSFTVTGLTPGTYYFQINAYSALGVQSAPSNEVSVTVTS